MNSPIEYRYTERTAFCRGCDKPIEKHSEKVATMYSRRNRGQHIYICQGCIEKIYGLILEDKIREE